MYTGLGGWLLKTDLSDRPPNSEVQSSITALAAAAARNFQEETVDLSGRLYFGGSFISLSRRDDDAIDSGLTLCTIT